MFDVVTEVAKLVWPWVAAGALFLWSFMTSRFAWWFAGVLANAFFGKSVLKRIAVAIVVWLGIVGYRIYVFIRLLFNGVMPWTQAHAWNAFLQLVECFVGGKADTGFMAFITVAMHAYQEGELEGKDFDMKDIGSDKKCGKVISLTAIRFLKILYQTTESDQKYLTALVSLVSRRDDSKIVGKAINKVMDELRAINLANAKKNYIKVGKLMCGKAIEFAVEKNDNEIAYRAVRLRHLIEDFEWHYETRSRTAVQMLDEIAREFNGVCAAIYVYCKMQVEKGKSVDGSPVIEVASVAQGEEKKLR